MIGPRLEPIELAELLRALAPEHHGNGDDGPVVTDMTRDDVANLVERARAKSKTAWLQNYQPPAWLADIMEE